MDEAGKDIAKCKRRRASGRVACWGEILTNLCVKYMVAVNG